jgi:DNA-binding response OmpR family regulator
VLCADAHAESRDWLQEVLGGFRLTFAPTGFEALRQIYKHSFDAFVLDYWLPDLAGTSLCREIRKVDPHAPIVFCSTARREQEQLRALRAGASAYLCKPCGPDALNSRLRAFLTASDLKSLHARVAEEAAVQDELERRRADTLERGAAASALAAASIERTARARAYRAYIAAQGSRARFDGWWPNVFQSATANRRRKSVNAARPVNHTPTTLAFAVHGERREVKRDAASADAETWRSRIALDNREQLRFWCRELGRTEAELKAAVHAVGTDVEKVREHLGRGAGCR